MNTPPIGKVIAFSLFSSCATSAYGATFAGVLEGITYSYTGHQSAYIVTMGVNDLPGLEEGGLYYALCLDYHGESYDDQFGDVDGQSISETVTTDLGVSSTFDDALDGGGVHAQNETVVIAQLGYLVDTYFEDKFVNGDSTERAAFGNAVWEIAHDGGRSASAANDLNFRTDDYSRGNSGSFEDTDTLFIERSAMLSAVEAESPQTHTWTTEHYLIDRTDDADQDYLMLRLNPTIVPEPSTALISLLGLGMALRRRR